LIGIPVDRPHMRETTALGAAIAAGFAAGVWKHFDDLKNINMEGRFYFEPKMPEKESKKMYRRWEKAVAMSKGWDDGDDEDEKEEEKKMEEGLN
jgi:glycerol kinase